MDNNLLIYKYKPFRLSEFIGNDKMKIFLNKMLFFDKLNFLLIGNQGTGKTSYLDVFLFEYFGCPNSKDYLKNILFINHSRDQGINYFRNEVKNFCQSKSFYIGKKKIVVLDNLDLISEPNQHIIRGLIDKYKENIYFIGSAISQQKLIEPIQSRMIIYKIPSITTNELNLLSKNIIKQENIRIQDDAINKIIKISNNSYKSLINIFDKIRFLEIMIDENIISKTCTNINYSNFDKVIYFLQNDNLKESIQVMNSLFQNGYSILDIMDNFYSYIKICDLLEEIKLLIIPIICKFISSFYNFYEDQIELSLFINNLYKILMAFKISKM